MKKITIAILSIISFITSSYSQNSNSTEQEPFVFAEQMPEFIGGDNALMAFLQKNIKYPAKALKNNIQGVVMINFVVHTDGSIRKANVTKGIGGGCDEEALRVIKKMPKWKPGMQAGKAVPVYFDVPVNFKID
jgi:protein TonB